MSISERDFIKGWSDYWVAAYSADLDTSDMDSFMTAKRRANVPVGDAVLQWGDLPPHPRFQRFLVSQLEMLRDGGAA